MPLSRLFMCSIGSLLCSLSLFSYLRQGHSISPSCLSFCHVVQADLKTIMLLLLAPVCRDYLQGSLGPAKITLPSRPDPHGWVVWCSRASAMDSTGSAPEGCMVLVWGDCTFMDGEYVHPFRPLYKASMTQLMALGFLSGS